MAEVKAPAIYIRSCKSVVELFFETTAEGEFGEGYRPGAKRAECTCRYTLLTHICPPIVTPGQWLDTEHLQHCGSVSEIWRQRNQSRVEALVLIDQFEVF